MAKVFLKERNMDFSEKVLNVDYTRDDLRMLIGENKRLTVPQIFINNMLIGGFEALTAHFAETK